VILRECLHKFCRSAIKSFFNVTLVNTPLQGSQSLSLYDLQEMIG